MSLRPIHQACRRIALTPHRQFGTSSAIYALGGTRTPHHEYIDSASSSSHPYLPRFLQPVFLRSLVPNFVWRKPSTHKQGWNPYTFFVAAFLVIGSQSINIIALNLEHKDFMRRTAARIDVLREVIERVQKGEDVDIEKMLGTGVEAEERTWEECEFLIFYPHCEL